MAKSTKKQARNIYDSFHGTLRCLNGGTVEENKRQSEHCYARLLEHVAEAEHVIANAGKLLINDEWLFEAVNGLSVRAQQFAGRYGL